jgi:hypothetical protein
MSSARFLGIRSIHKSIDFLYNCSNNLGVKLKKNSSTSKTFKKEYFRGKLTKEMQNIYSEHYKI